ncbi:MAG: peptide deformylase [Prevotellaceae bacterium]|jgi:peptide deformylase|nr:peptide deformylase [Prevotellaceae bacterium]
MILPIYLSGSNVLRKECEPLTPDYEGLQQLILDMFETMYNADGVGLAAPQIGKSIRLFVIDSSPMYDDDPNAKGFKKVFINPEILEYSGEESKFREGCLSIPEIHEEVVRKSKIKIRYFDSDFNEHIEEYDGIRARVIMHEYDHIEGVLFVDLLSPLRRKLIKKRLENIAAGKTQTNYKTI